MDIDKIINDFDFNFVEKFTDKSNVELKKLINDELIDDCEKIMIFNYETDNEDEIFINLVQYISKYSFIVYTLERKEEYEICSETKSHFFNIVNSEYEITNEFLDEMFNHSINKYRRDLNNEII